MSEEQNESNMNPIKEAKELLAKIEAANAKSAELLARQEELEAVKLLSGKAEAGVIPPKVIEETPKEYAARVMGGKK